MIEIQNYLVPGKLWKNRDTGVLSLVLAVHHRGEGLVALEGFSGTVKAGYVAIANVSSMAPKSVGNIELIPVSQFLGTKSAFIPVPRPGKPIKFMPGTTSAVRVKAWEQNLKSKGGARRTFSLTKPGMEALDYLHQVENLNADKPVYQNDIVNRLLVEEEQRVRKKLKDPK